MATKVKELTLKGIPSDRQAEFFKASAPHICYGGARGGGKSWALRRKFVMMCIRYPDLRLLMIRRKYQELEGNHILPLLNELNGFAKYIDAKKTFKFPNGSFIRLGYCDAENDVFQYQGQEYDAIGIDEATQLTQFQIQYIATSNRTTRTDFKPRMYYTCNPGGPGHDYIKRLFIDRNFTEYEKPEDYVFIPATVYDNKALMENDPQYINNLMQLPEHLRLAYLYGDWDATEGQYFSEFERRLHVVEPFDIPADWKRFRSMDWGYNDPCCVLWFAVAPDRRVFVYKEIYKRQVLASDMAKLILQRTDANEHISYTVASPDAWQNRGVKDVYGGENIAETFSKFGVPLMKADNSRLVGWQRVRENLALAPDGLPYLQIFSSCNNLIRTLPILVFDDHDHEDVSGRCEDHAAEALRYGCMSRPSPSRIKMLGSSGNVIAFDPFFVPQKQETGFFNL